MQIYLDTETHSVNDPLIVQMGMIICETIPEEMGKVNLDAVNTIDELINPGVPIEYEAMAVHHITNEMVSQSSAIGESLSRHLLDLHNYKGNYIIAHNAPFDVGAMKNSGLDISNYTIIDTLQCARHIWTDLSSYKLQYLRYAKGYYKQEMEFKEKHDVNNINTDLVHSALPDAFYLWMLTEDMLLHHTFEELAALSTTPILLKDPPFGKYGAAKNNGKAIPFAEVARKDRRYLVWMLSAIDNDNVNLKYTIEYYLGKPGLN